MNAVSRNVAEPSRDRDDQGRTLHLKDVRCSASVAQSETENHSSVRGAAREQLASFDKTPDDALVRLEFVCQLFSCSRATVWRWVKRGQLPVPYRFGVRFTAWRVGDLRRVLQSAPKSVSL